MLLKASKKISKLKINEITSFSLCTFVFSLTNNPLNPNGENGNDNIGIIAVESVTVEEYFLPFTFDFTSGVYNASSNFSINYKIYLDIKPGYSLQLVYGNKKQELLIKTSAKIQGNKVCRSITGFNILPKRSDDNRIISDSWITMGTRTRIHSEINKPELKEAKSEIENQLYDLKVFRNHDNHLYKPFKFELKYFHEENSSEILNDYFECTEVQVINKCQESEYKVLIAQLTTNEKLNFELDIQSGNISPDCLNFSSGDTKNNSAHIVNSTNNLIQTI
jgi:hypothetical protein